MKYTIATIFFSQAAMVAAAPRGVRKLQTGTVCEGSELDAVSNGCISAGVCATIAEGMGLTLGNPLAGWPFESDWPDKGCIYYPSDHPLYPNQAYFGTGGTCAQLLIAPSEGGLRVSCDGSTQPPFDPTACQGEYCLSADACAAKALNMGLSLGSDLYPFEGNWQVKGCVFFSENDPIFPGQAYWGTGASICGQLRADPADGSQRLSCTDTLTIPAPLPSEQEPVPAPLSPELPLDDFEEIVLTSEPQPTAATNAPTFSPQETESTTAPEPEPATTTPEPQPAVTPAPAPVNDPRPVPEPATTTPEPQPAVTPAPAPVNDPRPVPVPANVTSNDWAYNVSGTDTDMGPPAQVPVEPPAEMPLDDEDIDAEIDNEDAQDDPSLAEEKEVTEAPAPAPQMANDNGNGNGNGNMQDGKDQTKENTDKNNDTDKDDGKDEDDKEDDKDGDKNDKDDADEPDTDPEVAVGREVSKIEGQQVVSAASGRIPTTVLGALSVMAAALI